MKFFIVTNSMKHPALCKGCGPADSICNSLEVFFAHEQCRSRGRGWKYDACKLEVMESNATGLKVHKRIHSFESV